MKISSPEQCKQLRFDKRRMLLILSALTAVIAFCICAYYILYPAEGYLHSDCTDSLLWANATVESGEVFDSNFRYAAMLPFSASLWFVPLIQIFGYTMAAQTIGMMIFLVLFTLAAYFMCRSLLWSRTASFSMISALLLMLSGSDKLREIMWGHVIYYSWALLIIMTGIGLAARLCRALKDLQTADCKKTDRKKAGIHAAIYTVLMLILFTGNATNGSQVIVISTLSVFAGIFAERFFETKSAIFGKKNLPAYVCLALILVATLMGLSILDVIKGDKFANYTSVYSSYSALEDWFTNFSGFFKSYFSLIGVTVQSGDPLFARETLPSAIRVFGGIMILIVPVVTLCRYKYIKSSGTKILLWAHIVTSTVIMFGVICGKLGNANWRLTPMVGTAIMATVATVREFLMSAEEADYFGAPAAQLRLGVALCALIVLFSAVNANDIRNMPADYGRDNYLHVLAEELEERDLTYGYATFWRSQAITLLSDSKVKCRETLVNDNGIITDYYQSSKLWYADQKGVDRYFVILSKSEYDKVIKTEHWDMIMEDAYLEHFECAGCLVYVFDRNIILLGEFNG